LVVVPVVDDEDSSRLEQRVEVGDGQSVLALVSVDVGQVSERVSHAEDGVEALGAFRHADLLGQSQPVPFLDHYTE
jgi:hypothetical protein